MPETKALLLAATDTLVRTVTRTFSEIARDYGIWVVAGNYQAEHEVSTDPADIVAFAPDGSDEAYIARSARVTNQSWLWAPHDIDPAAPTYEKNLAFRNHKVPLTDMEIQVLGI